MTATEALEKLTISTLSEIAYRNGMDFKELRKAAVMALLKEFRDDMTPQEAASLVISHAERIAEDSTRSKRS